MGKLRRMKNQTHYRQGDVFIERIARIPDTAKKQKPGQPIILALGEATGHHHAIEIDDPDSADWWKKESGEQFVTLRAPARIIHQEHQTIELEAGTYCVRRQREYSPKAIRNVQD